MSNIYYMKKEINRKNCNDRMFSQIIQDPALAEIVMHIMGFATRINRIIGEEMLSKIEDEYLLIELLPDLIVELFMYVDFCLRQSLLSVTRNDIKNKLIQSLEENRSSI